MLPGVLHPAPLTLLMAAALPVLALAYPVSALLASARCRVLPPDVAWEAGEIVAGFLVALLVLGAHRGLKRAVARVADRDAPSAG